PCNAGECGCGDDAHCADNEICEAGRCVVGCRACPNDANPCTAASCDGGQCGQRPVPDGTVCPDDRNACTRDVCARGICTHPPVDDGTQCADEGNECTRDVCLDGACAHPPVDDGTGCRADREVLCTDDICVAGACAHPPVPHDPATVCPTNVFPREMCYEGTCQQPDRYCDLVNLERGPFPYWQARLRQSCTCAADGLSIQIVDRDGTRSQSACPGGCWSYPYVHSDNGPSLILGCWD
ncbi:MAG: hypothetical protein KC620_22875, partial [Myxococcales bacterium]|nr:hypothetical protein [Myxococcales bacterium]